MSDTKRERKAELKEVVATPLGDDDIRLFIPNANIIKYSELERYPTVEALLPIFNPYVFVLYEDSPNQGHWTCLLRYKNTVEFFDSYGGYPDSQQKWVDHETRVKLGAGRPLLTELLEDCREKVVYNPVQYQKDGSHINDCGRHCVLRILLNKKKGFDLADYNQFLKDCARKWGMDYDGVVSALISNIDAI